MITSELIALKKCQNEKWLHNHFSDKKTIMKAPVWEFSVYTSVTKSASIKLMICCNISI